MNGLGRKSGDLLFYVAAVTIPLGIFLCFFHWQILIPTNAVWLLDGDWGAHVIGWNALRHDDWRWPLAATKLLSWPSGVAVTFTDSNPLLSLLLKPFSAVLPTPFQFTGAWLLSCILLQFAVGYLLLQHATKDRWLRLLGATLLTLMPTLFNRMGHANLCAHWTILLSLHVFLNVERVGRRDLWYGAILVISALVHPYLLLMNAGIWGSDLLRRAYSLLRRRALAGLGVLAVRSAAVAVAPVAAIWATAGLGGYQGDADGFGFFSMPLDALFNPGRLGFSRFLPVAPQGDGQIFEGFQYLGAGLLLLVVAAALGALASPAARERLRRMSWAAWLAPALFVLLALALSDQIQFHGRVVADLSYDWIPFHLTSTFRASGRLFWPCAYVLMLIALELVFALPKALPLGIGLAALVLQAFDLTGFAVAMRTLTAAAAAPQPWQRTTSHKWEQLIASADVVEFQPPDPHADQTLFYEIAWRATSLKRPINVMYTARVNPEQKAFETAARSRFLRGELDPRHLYVLTGRCIPAGPDGARLKLVNKVMVIPPADAHYPFLLRPAPTPQPFPIGTTISIAQPRKFQCMLGRDWSRPEGWGVWSDGAAPELIVRLAERPERDLRLTVLAQAFPAEGQTVSVIAGGRTLGRWALTAEPAEHSVSVPRELTPGPLLHVVLKVDHPLAPRALGNSTDSRLLGVGLHSVRLDLAP
ncbi:DUF6311 domain-containing protein [Phenylobacterium sp. LjRoot225]|uniref:DUF6311 domain-containing protein n=1 Tax=Phenylobacterium sp. LjRoot225 TaxID=3342285 RepID=UPI003ED12D5C